MSASGFTLRRRTTTMAAVAMLFLGGLYTFRTMSRREDPEVTIREIPVITRWPGATAKKVEELVTDPLEKGITQIAEVRKITSISRSGLSEITVELEDRVDAVEQSWDDLRNKVAEVAPSLPDGATHPFVNEGFTDVFSVCLALYQRAPDGATLNEAQRYTYRDLEVFAETIEDELKRIPSVAKVLILGTQKEVIEVSLNAQDWAKIGRSEQELAQIVDARNIVAAGGEVDTGTIRFPLRTSGEFDAVDELETVVVGRRDGEIPVLFRDLPFHVKRTIHSPIEQKVRFLSPTERPAKALLLAVSMKDGSNVVAMGDDIRAAVRRLEHTTLPADLDLETVNDLPKQVDHLVSDFVLNLLEAIAIVLAVAFLMMGWRPALIMATAVPLSMVTSFVVVRLFGVELEQFSIASLIIALGMLVDNAIVVSDNISRLMVEGVAREEAADRGASSLAVPILTSTLTTVAAFLPMLTIPGSKGEYIRSLPIVVATTLLVSYLVAMLVTPILAYWLLPKHEPGAPPPRSPLERLLPRRKGGAPPKPPLYDRLIHACLRHRAAVILGAAALFVLSLQLVPLIGNQFFPQGIRNQFFVHVWLPEGSSIEATDAVVAQVEDRLLASDASGDGTHRLANAVAFVGSGGPRFFLTSSPEKSRTNYAYLIVNTTDPNVSADWARQLQGLVADIPGAAITVERYQLGPAVRYPVEILLSGPDDVTLRAKGQELMDLLRSTPGILNPHSDWGTSAYEYRIDVDPYRANLAGVTNQDVAHTLGGLIAGTKLTTYREGDHTVDVVLRVNPEQREDVSTLQGISVNGTQGKVLLSAIATLEPSWQPSVIARENQVRTITIGGKLAPGFLASKITADIEGDVDRIVADLPATYRWRYEGELGEIEESQANIASAFAISFFLILLILIIQYDSLAKPLIVLTAVPLSLIGALVGLWITGWPLGFMPMLGLVSLAGVVINNAIILIDFIKAGVAEGKPLRGAVAEAGRLRMKPILLTTLTTIGGMVPLALFAGPMWAGMAWAVIFGLAFSTAFTLLVVPTVFTLFVERFRMKV